MSTYTATPARNIANFIYELERHHGVSPLWAAASDGSRDGFVLLEDGSQVRIQIGMNGRTVKVTETDPQGTQEFATFTDYTRAAFAVMTYIQSICER